MDLRTYLYQRDIWHMANQFDGSKTETVRISEMSIEHRRKAARWLMNRAQAMIVIVEATINEGIISDAHDVSLRDVLSLISQDPRHWMRNTPLFQELIKDVPTRSVVDI